MPIDEKTVNDLLNTKVNPIFQNAWEIKLPDDLLSPFVEMGSMTTASEILNIDGVLADWREWTGERVYNDLAAYGMRVNAKDYELSFSWRPIDAEDNVSLFRRISELPAKIDAKAQRLPRRLMIALLKAGRTTNCYDGQFFFDTDHPVDPLGVQSTATFSNYMVSSPLNSANLNTAINTLEDFRAPNGDRLGVTVADMRLLIPTALRATARGLLEIDTLSGGARNPDYKLIDWGVVPELNDDPQAWYIGVRSSTAKPLIVLDRQKPRMQAVMRPNLKEIAYLGGHCRLASAYGLPQLMLKATAAAS